MAMSITSTAAILDGFGLIVYECVRATRSLTWLAEESTRATLRIDPAVVATLDAWIELVHPCDRQRVSGVIEQSLATGTGHHLEYRVVRSDGTVLDVTETARPAEPGAPCLHSLIADVTSQRRAERELRQSELRLMEAHRIAGLGHWEWNCTTDELEWSPEIYRIFGLAPGPGATTYSAFLDRVHPEDRALVTAAVNRALAGNDDYSLEHRIMRPDGRIRFVHERALATFDEGKPVRMLGTVQDVTDHHDAEEALRESEERFRQIVDNIDVGLWIATPGGEQVLYVSPGVERIWRRDRSAFVQNPQLFLDAVHPEDRAEVEPLYALDGVHRECRIVHDDGEVRWLRIRVFPVRDRDGSVYRAAAVAEDVTQQHIANAQMATARDEIQRSLAEKSALLREIHHRVKNNLQVVSSLLYLQSAVVADRGVQQLFHESRHRILTMAYIHETLYQSDDLSSIDFGAYVRKLIGGIVASYSALAPNATIDTDVDAMRLDLDTAVPCGLVINELVTNALKYAFPDGRKGCVRVSFRVAEDGARVLTVDDDGIGLPANAADAASLGLKLVRTLASQIRATFSVDRSAGTSFRIALPAS